MKVVLVLAAVLLPFVAASPLVGGEKSVKLNENDDVVAFASSQINAYLTKQNKDAKPSAVIEVISATRQTVAGVLYRLKLKMTGEPKNKICRVQLLIKAWLQQYEASNIHCEDESHGHVNKHAGNLLGGDDHDKQSHGKVMPGGIMPMDIDENDAMVTVAASAVNDLLKTDEHATVVKVLSASKQVVSGILYRLKLKMSGHQICDVSLLQQVWISPKYQVSNVKCKPEVQALLGGDGHDQQAHGKVIPGGQSPIDVALTDDKVTFATSAVNSYLKGTASNAAPTTVVKVLSATEQVVSGMRYTLELQMSNNQICTIKLLSQPWIFKGYQLETIHCKAEVAALLGDKKSLVGAPEPADFDDEMVKQALAAVTDRFNMQINSPFRHIPSEGTVTKQVVNGVIYRFRDVEMKPSSCMNNDDTMGKFTVEECPVAANAMPAAKVNAKIYWNHHTFDVQQLDILP